MTKGTEWGIWVGPGSERLWEGDEGGGVYENLQEEEKKREEEEGQQLRGRRGGGEGGVEKKCAFTPRI